MKTSFRKMLLILAIVLLLPLCIISLPTLLRALAEEPGEDASDRIILGLDVPNYAERTHLEVSPDERRWIRNHKLEIRWEKLQPQPGSFKWNYYDKQINAVLSDGSQSILLLLGGPVPAWARDMSYGGFASKAPPANLNDWYTFCSAVADRYGSVADYYEIWNEPGWDQDGEAVSLFGTFHFGGQVETDYLPLLRLAYTAIEERDPAGVVICGALIETLNPDPETGTQLYSSLFDDSRRLFTDISVEINADEAIKAERIAEFHYGVDQQEDGTGNIGGKARPEWYFAEGSTGSGIDTWLVLENGGDKDASVALRYCRENGNSTDREVILRAESRLTIDIRQDYPGAGRNHPDGEDISIVVSSDLPIKAERSMYFNGKTGSNADHEPVDAIFPDTRWSLDAGYQDYSVRERVCLLNPGTEDAAVIIDYYDLNGNIARSKELLTAGSRLTLNIGDHGGPADGHKDSDLPVLVASDQPIIAERSMLLDYAGNCTGNHTSPGADSPSRFWSLAGHEADYTLRETLRLENGGNQPVRADLEFTMRGLRVSDMAVDIPAESRISIDANAVMGFNAFCDIIGVHNYKRPENWGPHYSAMVRALRSIGVNKELAVTEVGWPHYQDDDADAFSMQQQTDAIGSQGIGSLREAGCRKIWVYKDMDEAPGKSWDKRYFGLFGHDGSPHPSWQRYREWQEASPDYPWLPTSLP